METQTAKKICKLTNKELTMMVNNAFITFTQGKTEERKATYIYEAGGFLSSFMHCCQHDDNTIFLSLLDVSYFNPLCVSLYSEYPNIAEEAMRDDNLTALVRLINMLAAKGYKIAIRDTFYNLAITLLILDTLTTYGYDTSMVAFKNDLYNDCLRRIYSQACDLIAVFKANDLGLFQLPMQTLLNYLTNDLVSSIYVSDGILDQQYTKDTNGIQTKFIVNKLTNYIEPDFYRHLEALIYFIEKRRSFLKDDDYFMLMKEIEILKKSYYRSIDITLFDTNKAR